MLFNSFEFLLFFPVIYILYLLLKHRWQNRILILASCLFYAAWNWKFLSIMFASITIDYFCGRRIDQSNDPKIRKRFLCLSIFVNLAILGFFKYANFFTANLDVFLKFFPPASHAAYIPLKIILPLGISFYTFEAISYTVDIYRREARPAQSYMDYLLFVLYFPHLIAGPIMRAKNFLPQISLPRLVTAELFFEGCYWFFWGLFEKMFVADNLAKIVDPVFASSGPYEGGTILLALYAFSFQIFCDFDGYSNMARGLGKCMGFDITINFRFPYFATNPREFWRRWHISLSTWLRDYLYIPLGGDRKGNGRMYFSLLLTMLLGGLWHGAAWTFVCWGAYHAILLIIHRRCTDDHPAVPTGRHPFKDFLKIVFFFHLMVLGWLLFRVQSFSQIRGMIVSLLFNFKWNQQDFSLWVKSALIVLPLLTVQILQFKANDLLVVFKQHWLLKTVIYALMTYLLLGWGIMKTQKFYYFQF